MAPKAQKNGYGCMKTIKKIWLNFVHFSRFFHKIVSPGG